MPLGHELIIPQLSRSGAGKSKIRKNEIKNSSTMDVSHKRHNLTAVYNSLDKCSF